MKTFFCSFLLAMLFASGMASVPGGISYQAVVRTVSGNLIANDTVSFRLGILKGSPSNLPVYVETHTVVTSGFGVAALTIGRGAVVSGDFSLINWSDDDYFLETGLDTAGGTGFVTIGVTQFLSVPYALHAGTCDNSGNYWIRPPGSQDIYFSNGRVGIGTSFPDERLKVMGNLSLDTMGPAIHFREMGLLSGKISHVPPADGGYLHFQARDFTTSFETTGLVIQSPSQQVGIGTLTPMFKLDVAGTAKVNGFVMPSGAVSGYILGCDGSGSASWIPNNTLKGSGAVNYIPKYAAIDSLGTSGIFEGDSAKAGFGTTSPKSKLHLHSTQLGPGNTMKYLKITNPHTGSNYGDGIDLGYGSNENTLTASLMNREGGDLFFGTFNAERFRITYDGKVGFFTQTPAARVHIRAGDNLLDHFIVCDSAFVVTKEKRIGMGIATPQASLHMKTSLQDDYFRINHDDFIIKNDGSVGIGTATPSALLEIRHKSGYDGLKVGSGDLIVKSSGNVGIHNSSPEHLLDVNGTAQVTGDLHLGQNLEIGGNVNTNNNIEVNANGKRIIIRSGSSVITINEQGEISIENDGGIDIRSNQGNVSISGKNVSISAQNNFTASGIDMHLSSVSTTIQSDGLLHLVGAMTNVQGYPIMLNGNDRQVSGLGDGVFCTPGGTGTITSGNPFVVMGFGKKK